MDYSQNYFGKALSDLTFTDIENYFVEEKDESVSIEFKSYSATYGNLNRNLEGVIRGICAFLNSEGGILIWGAPEGTTVEGRQERVFVGELSPIPELKEKDWLINKISDSINPLPVGIQVQIFENEGNYVYLFMVQQSTFSPHQFKNIYYARLDGQTKPSPHYLIEALFKKITYPNIESYIKPDKILNNGTSYFLDLTIFVFNFSELQNEEDVSFRLMCPEGIFTKSTQAQHQHMYSYEGHQLIHKGLINVLHHGSPNMHTERIMFNPNQLLTENENKVTLLLSFGGKHSPLKFCEYKLDFARINWNDQDDPNYLIEEMSENILSSEKQKQVNSTREDLLKSVLKR